jgi:hypothetical protein
MYLAGFSLNNLSLMALTISTGFVVDDAIVMIENIFRYIEAGESPLEAALKGSRQNRIHRYLSQLFPDRSFHSVAFHDRNRGQVIQGVCDHSERSGHCFGDRFTDANADDVREIPEADRSYQAGQAVSLE